MSATALRPTLYGSVPETPREDLLRDYLAFLGRRNGSTEVGRPFPERERWLEAADGTSIRHQGELSAADFEHHYVTFDPKREASKAMIALLALVKMNAGEAYGVEVVSRHRHRGREPKGVFEQVERVLGTEETYHTRILVGAAGNFGLEKPTAAWTPPLGIKVLIGSLAYSPKALFHPILLAAEIGGVFMFNWMLQRLGEVFRDEPALRESLEARMVEILIDEVGHLAFNRLAVGPWGMSTARKLAPHVAHGTTDATPEFKALGWTSSTADAIPSFELSHLPEEVLRRAFFV